MPVSRTSASENQKPVRAPRGPVIACEGWQQEAALRLLMNSLDPDLAENPRELVVCCGREKAAYDWEAFHAIVEQLKVLADDETLKIDTGRPAGVQRTAASAPRLVIASTAESSVGPSPGKLLAAGWLHIGTQTTLPFAYELFAYLAREHFSGSLCGKLVISGGMGAFGGALPLAASLNGAAFLGIDADAERIKRRVKSGYCDVLVTDLDESLRILKNAVRKREPVSVGLVANCAELIPALARRGVVPDLLTDCTSADDLESYIPARLNPAQVDALLAESPEEYRSRALASIGQQLQGMFALQKLGSLLFDSGNHFAAVARDQLGLPALEISAFDEFQAGQPFQSGRSILQWVALSGEPSDIYRIDRLALEIFPDDSSLENWLGLARKRVRFQGLPARVSWLDTASHRQFAIAINDLVADGELKAPVVLAPHAFGEISASSSNSSISALLENAHGASWFASQVSHNSAKSLIARAVVVDGSPASAARLDRFFKTE